MTLDPTDLPTLTVPAHGVPPVTSDVPHWKQVLSALASGDGPVAIDVERAQGYRYSNKAYLLQMKRPGAGIVLVDPVALAGEHRQIADLTDLQEVIGDQEWILHAATQDLPNLVELGLRPSALFDTELAGRLLGLEKVGLGAMVESYCGVHLLKEHSAVDWSTRPIPTDWLAYAALDVELLHDLRERLIDDLQDTGKLGWAREEFDHLCRWALTERPPRSDPWRRTSGCHRVTSRRGLALVRQLWMVREELAEAADLAHGKILQDKAITELAATITRHHPDMPDRHTMRSIDGFKRRRARAHEQVWLQAISDVARMTESELPPMRALSNGIPMPKAWEKLRPEAHARWERIRPQVMSLAEELRLPVENLISPDALRHLLWEPAGDSETALREQLTSLDVRCWQQDLVVPVVLDGLG